MSWHESLQGKDRKTSHWVHDIQGERDSINLQPFAPISIRILLYIFHASFTSYVIREGGSGMFLDNISIKKKLYGGFIIIIALAIIIALIGYLSMGDMTKKAEQMYDDNLVSLDQLLNADNSFLNIRINIYKTVFAKDERADKFVEIDQEILNIKGKIDMYRANASSPDELALLSEFDKNWPVFEKSLRQVITDMNAGKEEAALEGIYSDNFKIPRDAAQDALDKLELYNQEQSRHLKLEIVQTYQVSSLLFFIIGVFTLLFGLAFALVTHPEHHYPADKNHGYDQGDEDGTSGNASEYDQNRRDRCNGQNNGLFCR